MNTAEWILVCILSGTLFIFLICGIVFLIKLIGLTNEAKKFTITANEIARKADSIAKNVDGVAENVRNITYTGTIAGLMNMIRESYRAKKAKREEENREGENQQ